MRIILLAVLALDCLSGASSAEIYDPGDWITYADFRHVVQVLPARNMLYALTDRGILRYDRLGKKWAYPWTAATGLPQKSWRIAGYQMLGDRVWLISPDSSFCYYNDVFKRWVTTETPPQEFDRTPAALPATVPAYICQTAGYRFSPEGRYLEDNLLRQSSLAAIEEDERGDHWLGFPGVGVGLVPYRSLKISLLPYGLNRTDATTLAFDRQYGAWWFAGLETNGGITMWVPTRDWWRHFEPRQSPGLTTGRINNLAFDSLAVWLATNQGLVHYDRVADRWHALTTFDGLGSDAVTCLAADGDYLWAGTLAGLARITAASVLITRVGEKTLANLPVYDVAADSDKVWLVAEGGVYLYYKKQRPSQQWEILRDLQGKLEFDCTCVLLDDTLAWLAGRNFVAAFDRARGTWEYWLPPHFFAPCVVHAMDADSENVWFATDRGALKFHKQYRRWRSYTVADGLAHDFVGSVQVAGDYVWFGTRLGATRYYWKRTHRID